ncbi:phosphatase PAP2 family protein [Paenarthrobacter histidinolovorans]|uniref:Membrane-associated phospholipid phosphatase n=1 Tax=Paenarthrobacter histidinolovorans TaxID=43664 RepID=A0ABW8MZH2_9MICC
MTAGFWGLLVVLLARLYFVIRWKAPTDFLGATALGVLGLVFAGAVWPVDAIDGYLGSINLWHLLRNLCVTGAVWLVREGIFAAQDHHGRGQSRHPMVFLGIVVAIVVPFLCQDFVPSTPRYIPENVTQVPVFVYGTVYMGALAAVALSVIRECFRMKDSLPLRVSSRIVAGGMACIVFACLDEITFMTIRVASLGSPDQQLFFYATFPITFYSGVAIVAAGLGVPPIVRFYRRLVDRGYEQVIRAKDQEALGSPNRGLWFSKLTVRAAWLGFRPVASTARTDVLTESSPLTTTAQPATSRSGKPFLERVARLATEIAQPPLVLSLLLILASLKDSLGALYAGLIASLLMCLIPWLAVVVLARKGRLSDHHVGDRKQRRPVMLWTLGSSVLACAVLTLMGAPVEVWALIAGILTGIAVLILLSPLWKISGHAITLGGAAASSILIFGWLGLPFVIAAPLVCWSRVYLKDHSGAQVVAGFATGVIVFTCSYILVTA